MNINPYLQNKYFNFFVFLILISFSWVGCSVKDGMEVVNLSPSAERGSLVSYSKTGSMTASQVISINQSKGALVDYAKFDLDIYTVVYNSLDGGAPLQVSGLVLLPQNVPGSLDLIQHHHGTLIPGFDDGAEPSLYEGGASENSELSFIGLTMAANGYVVSLPDYVGYGFTSDREHPYTVHHELAEVSVDMLRATEQLLAELSVGFTKNVFLTGWSEGGGAGLATHQYLEEQYPDAFNLKASSLLAGPYDYFGFVKDLMTNREEENANMAIYSWSVYSLNNYTSNLQRNTNTIWTYDVVEQADAIAVVSDRPDEILQTTFMDGMVNETDATFVAAAKANSLIEGWTPRAKLYFHSGTNDRIVPHYNSTRAHAHFQSIGVSSVLYEYPGGDHFTPEYEYVTKSLDDFNNL